MNGLKCMDYGLIGFFDILGYKSFLANNSASDTARNVLHIINNIPKKAVEFNRDLSKSATNHPYAECGAAFKHLVFSDTIVFLLPYQRKSRRYMGWYGRSFHGRCFGSSCSRNVSVWITDSRCNSRRGFHLRRYVYSWTRYCRFISIMRIIKLRRPGLFTIFWK